MGVIHTTLRSNAPLALALLLALAGSTSSIAASGAGGSGSETASIAPSSEQSAASVTKVTTGSTETSEGGYQPAIRIAATARVANPVTRVDVPNVLLKAYRSAAAAVPASCHLPVSLLAAIGEVESGSLVGRQIDARHRTSILGPVLDGNGFAAVPDTDGGKWDGDAQWDRAMGPMQFIPSTWRTFGVDGDRDGVADPQDVEDASATTAAYLCYGGRDLSDPAVLGSAVLSYNHSQSYERLVLTYQQRFARLGLDRGSLVTGLSSPVDLVTMQSLGAIEAMPVAGTTRIGTADLRRGPGRAHHPAKATKGTTKPSTTKHATKPTKTPTVKPTPTPTATPTPSPTPTPTPTAGCWVPDDDTTPEPVPEGTVCTPCVLTDDPSTAPTPVPGFEDATELTCEVDPEVLEAYGLTTP